MAKSPKRLIIVSNRLPIVCQRKESGEWIIESSAGGLVTALDPVFKNRGGYWIGWPGTTDVSLKDLKKPLSEASQGQGYGFIPVSLTPQERDNFYLGFSNEVIWPLFHDLQTMCHFHPAYFQAYEAVNRKFAWCIAKHSQTRDLIWVHDYHLMDVAANLRTMGVKSPLAFFLHIPFPPLDIFLKLPWRAQILKALLQFDLIGLQTPRDVRNFLQCLRLLGPKNFSRAGNTPREIHRIAFENREISIGSFPVGIDYEAFSEGARSEKVEKKLNQLRSEFLGRHILLGADRLDYTKGILQKLEAFRLVLERHPELHGKLTLIQYVVPSRENIAEYHDLKIQIEQRVGEINGHFTFDSWVPIHYRFQSLDRPDLLSYYRLADTALVTPLKDGMNLVAKEYCAAKTDKNGVLVLSEFAGAAASLQKGALLVNPYDIEGVANAILESYSMKTKEKHSRMGKLQKSVASHDIFTWADRYLYAAISEDLSAFHPPQDYLPDLDFA